MLYVSSFFDVPKNVKGEVMSIALSKPAGVRVDGELDLLKPTWKMVKEYRDGGMSELEYRVKYVRLIRERVDEFVKWVMELDNDEDVWICCWERKGFCHRFMVADAVRGFREDIEVILVSHEHSEDSRGERLASLGVVK